MVTDILTGLVNVWEGVNIIGSGGLLATIILITIGAIGISKNTEDQLIWGLVGLSMTLFAGTVIGLSAGIMIIIAVTLVVGGIFTSINTTG